MALVWLYEKSMWIVDVTLLLDMTTTEAFVGRSSSTKNYLCTAAPAYGWRLRRFMGTML